MIELQIKDLETNEILATGTVEQMIEMYEDDDDILSAIDEVQSSKQSVKVFGFVGASYELSIVRTETDAIKETLLNAGLNVAQINDYTSETEEKSFTVFAYYLGRYVTMTIFYADHAKYVHVSISALVYHATQIEFADGCLDEALVEACNFVKQYTHAN